MTGGIHMSLEKSWKDFLLPAFVLCAIADKGKGEQRATPRGALSQTDSLEAFTKGDAICLVLCFEQISLKPGIFHEQAISGSQSVDAAGAVDLRRVPGNTPPRAMPHQVHVQKGFQGFVDNRTSPYARILCQALRQTVLED